MEVIEMEKIMAFSVAGVQNVINVGFSQIPMRRMRIYT
jgi:hypothetical protein